MLGRLWVRLLLIIAVVLGIAVVTIAVVVNLATTSEFRDYESEGAELMNRRLSRIAGRIHPEQGWPGVATSVQRQAEAADLQIVIVDQQGLVVVDTDKVLAVGSSLSRTARIRTAPSLAIADLNGATIGTIYVRPKDQDRAEAFLAGVNRALAFGGGLGVLMAFVVSLLLARRIVIPIERLISAVQKMQEGDLSQRVPKAGGEVAKLSEAFNTMAVRLDMAQRLRRNMVADIAHELRTPLHNVLGYLEMLRDGVTEPTPGAIAGIHEEASILKRLVDDLQQLAMVESGQFQLSRRPASAVALLRQAAAIVDPEVSAKGVQVVVEADPDLPNVFVDEARIGQVLRNLLSNAISFTPGGGRITLSAKRLGGPEKAVEIAVEDTGPGIDPADLPYIFERFYRADASRTRTSGGAGLGLTIAKELVEAHGGTIRVDSDPGKGASFRLTLPIAPLPAMAVAAGDRRGR
ncbi:MAG: HAMP domain-containing protein [Chloroflexi bacterium]|nr:HAMP domain-containing protein [Chloroflexota bacterium]